MRAALILALALSARALPAVGPRLRGPRDDEVTTKGASSLPLLLRDEQPAEAARAAAVLPLPSEDERRRLSASSCKYFQLSGARAASLNGVYASDGGTCNGLPRYKLNDHWLYAIATDQWMVSTAACQTSDATAVLKLYGRALEVAPPSRVIRLSSYSYPVGSPTQSYYSEQTAQCEPIYAVNLALPPTGGSSTLRLQAWACASRYEAKAKMEVVLGNYGLAPTTGHTDCKANTRASCSQTTVAALQIRMEGYAVGANVECYRGGSKVYEKNAIKLQPIDAGVGHFNLPSQCIGADRVKIYCGGHCGVCRIAQLQVTAKTGWIEDDSGWQPNCDVSTKCAWKARLGGDRNSIYEGRVEVEKSGESVDDKWGTVCDDNWDINDAHVACRQIFGQPAEARFREAHFGEGNNLRIWMDDVHCNSGEAALSLCPFNPDAEKKHFFDCCGKCEHDEDAGVRCRMCDVGSYARPLDGPSLQSYECTVCDAGKASNAGRDDCDVCNAGTVSAAGQGSCDTCGPGLFSEAGQALPCTKCGDDPSMWEQSWWNPNQEGLTSKDDCLCKDGRTGANCELEECAATTPVVSLGFLLLEAQWPRHERTLSRNEDFSAISGAFRNFDTDGNNHLSVDEAQEGIADGGIAVPKNVRHIWSRELASGAFVKIFADATACTADATCSFEGQFCPPTAAGSGGDGYCCQGSKWKPGMSCRRDLTITDMVNDELARLAAQGTKEFHERRAGSGDIVEMTATYPSRLMSNETCAAKSTKFPKLDWTLDRQGKTIFKQCAYFNGERLTREEDLADSVASGGPCNDVEGESIEGKCSYEFELPSDYVVTSYHQNDCVEPGTSTYDGRTLHCIELPSGELVDVLEVENAPTTCKVSDANACPAGYNIWVPRNYEHARAVREAVDPKFTYLVGVYGTASSYVYPSTSDYPMESNSTGAIEAGWTSVAGKGSPWFLRNTTYGQPDGNYKAGCWLTTKWVSGWTDGAGFLFDDNYCAYCHNNYLCSRNGVEVLDISTQSYCVETKFCPGGVNCTSATADPKLTAMRCTTGLQYDGTVWDVFPRMKGTLGISLQWLDTRYKDTTGFRVYKVKDANTPFADDTSALLLREFVVRKAQCGLTFNPLEFRDLTTGSEPGFDVGYVVVPMNKEFDEVKSEAGSSGFIVPWFGDIRVSVEATGGGPVKGVTVKVSHLLPDGTDDAASRKLDPAYIDFAVAVTDDFGDAKIEIRVHDRSWSDLSQYFRVTVEKTYTDARGVEAHHTFSPELEEPRMSHLGESNLDFKDTTSVSITGTVAYDGFGAEWFSYDCPFVRSGTCICSVDGAEVMMTRASGADEEVTLQANGSFATAALRDETVTLWLRPYKGTSGGLPHNFTLSHDASGNATVRKGAQPSITFKAGSNVEVKFLDTSTQRLSAALVLGAGGPAADFVTGLPMVAKVERCGWQQWEWSYKGQVEFLLAATEYEVRTLDADEATQGKFYHPPRDENPDLLADSCSSPILTKEEVIAGTTMLRGCRPTIPEVEVCNSSTPDVPKCQTAARPCAKSGYDFVDELPKVRTFAVDLTSFGTGGGSASNSSNASSPAANEVNFIITAPLCLASVEAAAAGGATLQGLIDPTKTRETALSRKEDLLLSPPTDFSPPEGSDLYGAVCPMTDTNALFREGDAVDFTFELMERTPQCYANGIYPWDARGGVGCSGYKDTKVTTDAISIEVADALSGTEVFAEYNGPYRYTMVAAMPNPFAPFSKEMSLSFTRSSDNSQIIFVRHALILGVIPEEVPQVWTAATNPTLIFMIIRDPPGGGSTTTLIEGSTISTSMAIDGAHSAELAEDHTVGFSAGTEYDMTAGYAWGPAVLSKILGVGAKAGISYAHASPDITVKRASSRHFDVSIGFSMSITTSHEEDLAGQPSDLIIGGGANLRFISAIEVYAKKTGGQLCVHGRDTKQFLPEEVTTYVMSVYEIEQTMLRLGAALRNPNGTKLSGVGNVSVPSLEKQIDNWKTVLANYREVTARDKAETVAELLMQELEQHQKALQGFLVEATANGDTKFSGFLGEGLERLEEHRLIYQRYNHKSGLPSEAKSQAGDKLSQIEAAEAKDENTGIGNGRLRLFERDVKDRANKAANECIKAASLAEPDRPARLCDVYHEIGQAIDLNASLFGICDFAKSCCKDASEVCTCRDAAQVDESGSCDCCRGGDVPKCAPVDQFCKRDHYRDGQKIIGAFDALTNDPHQFITFAGSTALSFKWNTGEARGETLTSAHSGSAADSLSGNIAAGGEVGRRRLDDGVPGDALAGYAYPATGRVLAVSKKLLEVTPEALQERRRLEDGARPRSNAMADETEATGLPFKEAPKFKGNPCRRRLLADETLTAEERRLGVKFCMSYQGSHSMSFDVSLGRAASKSSGHTHEVVVSLQDENPQDIFAVKIAQDPVYGTPIFTTLGGRSSCPGETGTTKRDSRVTLEAINPLCPKNGEVCDSALKCKCEDLKPGQSAIFSAVVQNISPWQMEVMYMIRAVRTMTAWDAGKMQRTSLPSWDRACPAGDPGSLSIKTLDAMNMRAPGGATLTPLPYGQFEIRFEVKRPDFGPQCSKFTDIELEVVPMCERIHGGDPHSLYIYKTSEMDDNGNVKVVHPVWDNSTYDFTPETKALGITSSKKSFDVSWSTEVRGCKYADASNYNQAATVDDDSCIFPISGCKYAAAVNYNPMATIDDESCVFSKMPSKFQSLACDADEHIGRKYSSACRVLRLSNGAVFSNGLTSNWAKNWANPKKCAQRSKDKDSAGKLKFATQWCPAVPFVCTVPNSCLFLDNHYGVVRSVTWGFGKAKASCLAKAGTGPKPGRFVVKWCPEHLADFATDSPTPRPAA